MRKPLHRVVTGALLLSFGATGAASVPAAAAETDPADHPQPRVRAATPDVDLPRAAHGARALELLGDQLGEAAHLNGRTAQALRDLLLADRSVWLDEQGALFYVDAAHGTGAHETTGSDESTATATAPYPLDQSFSLHSKPGSSRTIFLDFDGSDVSGTAWNDRGLAAGFHAGWSTDADAGFSSAERTTVQSVWQRVAEDFAPFDVDVTTQDPGAAALDRSSNLDGVYGTRVLVSDSTRAHTSVCGGGCGGVAYVDVFDRSGSTHAYYQPAWVFPAALGDDAKSIAEAASHEVGHNLGLDHDGGTQNPAYYSGHATWAPIMGAGYDRALTQWSKGDYTGATNRQDDVAVILGNGLGERQDEAGPSVVTAGPSLPAGAAYVSSRTDTDVYLLGQCSGTVTVAGRNAPTSPDLDLSLRLLDGAGQTVASAAPDSTGGTRDVANGLDATVSASVASAKYYVAVDGVGNGGFPSQYDDYGSLGSYTLTQTGCSVVEPVPTAPSEPRSVVATAAAAASEITLTWEAPLTDGGSPVTGYTVSRSGGTPVQLGATARSHTFTGLAAATTYTLTVRAGNAVGAGPAASATATTAPGKQLVSVPTVPRDLVVTPRALAGEADLSWAPPASDGGSPVLHYVVTFDGQKTTVAPGRSVTVSGLQRGREYAVSVAAVNAAGTGPALVSKVALPGSPPRPDEVALDLTGMSGTLSWETPSGYDPALITGWEVTAVLAGAATETRALPAGERSLVRSDLPLGDVRFEVTAVSDDLVGATASSPTRTVVGTATVPRATVIGTATPGARGGSVTATARWSAPSGDGGARIDGYQVTSYRLDAVGRVVATYRSTLLDPAARSAVLRLPAARYRFAVRAHNVVGYGALSSRSSAVRAR